MPDWILNPPKDSAAFYYGVGSGDSRDAARLSALADIAAKLRTELAVETQVQQRLDDQGFKESYQQSIAANIDVTRFSRFSVEQSHGQEGRYWLLVKIARDDLLADLQDQLYQARQQLDDATERYRAYSMLRRFSAGGAILTQIDQIQSLLSTLRAVATDRDVETYGGLQSLRAEVLANNDRLLVTVKADSEVSDLSRQLMKLLVEQRVAVSNQGQGNAVIELSAEVERFSVYDEKQVQLKLTVVSYDSRGRIIASNHYVQAGYSRSSYKMAIFQANQKLSRRFQELGVFAALGLLENS
jgi:hypothetical protein